MRGTVKTRRAVVLMAVIVALAVMGTLFLVILQRVAVQRRQSRIAEVNLQSLWLAQSGLERAAAQLHASSDYTGETWSIPADQVDGRAPATVEIKVKPLSGANRKQVTVIAKSGAIAGEPARRTLVGQVAIASKN